MIVKHMLIFLLAIIVVGFHIISFTSLKSALNHRLEINVIEKNLETKS